MADTIRPTRYKELGYRNDGNSLWRIYDVQEEPAAIGPFYRTKAELLADLDRFAAEYGAEGAATPTARGKCVFALTTLKYNGDDGRTVGIYQTIEDAEQVLLQDQIDADEGGWYIWAVIEQVPFGAYAPAFRDRALDRWYEYDKKLDLWRRVTELPEGFEQAWETAHPGWPARRIAAWCKVG